VSLHVAHVIDALALGGAERMAVELANRSVADGRRTSLCVTRSALALASRLDPRIELLVLGRQRRFELRPLVRLARWLRDRGVDVVHCHGQSSFSLVAVLRAVHAIDQPIVLHDHRGLQLQREVPSWFGVARRWLAAYAAVDPAQLAWAERAGIPPARRRVIGNAIDIAALARQRITGDALPAAPGPRLIFVGGLRREKALDVLLDALPRLAAPVTLFVVGGDADPAYAAACRAQASAPALAGRVAFLGARDDALALAATADLAVHPARSESGPLVVAEYAALAIPFVATRVGAIATELAAAGAGAFVAPDDPVALAVVIERMLALPADERRRRAAASAAIAAQRFDVSVAMPRWYQLYAELAR
jgi:glycosyltransferase involved in cell wall biosynthesis